MKRSWLFSLIVVALLVANVLPSRGQVPTPALGDYGSAATGSWDTVSTWKLYSSNGAFDSTATAVPSSSYNVFVRTGTTVTYQTSSQNCRNLVIEAGGRLQSNATLPTGAVYLKINGPIVQVDGAWGSGPTDALSLETRYDGTITLSGTGVINIAQVRPNSAQAGTMSFVFAANTNINYAGSAGTGGAGIYTSRGTQTSSTITINPGVTVNFATGSHYEMASSSSVLGTMNTTLIVNGTMNLPGSSVILADSARFTSEMKIGPTGVVNIGKKLTPYLTGGGVGLVDVTAGGALNILSGATADYSNPSAVITGAGTFALREGGGIDIGAAAGLDSAEGPIRTAIASFDSGGTYSYVGTGVQEWGSMLPDSIRNLTIGTNSIDTSTVTDPKKVTGLLRIDGLLVDDGGLTSAGSAIVNGTYQLNNTSGPIPLATWNTGSTCFVTGLVTIGTAGIPNGNQNFYNYTVDCPGLLDAQRLGFDTDTLRGNLTIHNTNDPAGAANNYIALAPKGTNSKITILGDLIIDSTSASLSIGTGSTPAIQSLYVKGNIISKGCLYLNGSGVTNKIFAYGDISIQRSISTAFRGHSALAFADSVIFCGTGIQKFTKPVTNTSMTNLRYRVLSGSTLWLNDTTTVPLSGSTGAFGVDSGATLILGHPGGMNGAITRGDPALVVSLSSGATYEFNGDSAQVTGTLFPTTVRNLIINDSLGVTLSASDTITGTLSLTKGNLFTGANRIALAPSGSMTRSVGYVIGNLQKQFLTTGSRDFEVGTVNGYSPVTVNVTAGSGAMTVAAVQGQHPNSFDVTKTLARYWALIADPGITKADLKFTYLAPDVNGNESIYGAWRYSGSGTSWTALTSNNHIPEHYVTTTGVTSFSDWTLGESPVSTSVETAEGNAIPKVFFVRQNYPNPFNPTTRIIYGLPDAAHVTAKVYNLLGQEVATIFAGEQTAGVHVLEFDGSHLSSGVYLYRIQAGNSVEIKRTVLVK